VITSVPENNVVLHKKLGPIIQNNHGDVEPPLKLKKYVKHNSAFTINLPNIVLKVKPAASKGKNNHTCAEKIISNACDKSWHESFICRR